MKLEEIKKKYGSIILRFDYLYKETVIFTSVNGNCHAEGTLNYKSEFMNEITLEELSNRIDITLIRINNSEYRY